MTGTHQEIRCPKCDASIFVNADQLGETIKCPRCQNPILVPGEKKNSGNDITVDDLIDLDDDVLHPNPESESLAAKSIDDAVAVVAGAASDTDDLMDELKLAADPDSEPSPDGGFMPSDKTSNKDIVEIEPDDDLGDLIDVPRTEKIDEQNDPFEVDPNANLEVDGVTPADGQFGVDCLLCGSLLYARVSQVGTKIKCHDCHSLIEVPKPRVKPTPVPEKSSKSEESAGYTLTDPYELEPIDTTFDETLGDIDYNDDEFFERKRELEGRSNESGDGSDEEVYDIQDAVAEVDVPAPGQTKDKKQTSFTPPKKIAATDPEDSDEYLLSPVDRKLRSDEYLLNSYAGMKQTTNISEPISSEEDEEPEHSQRIRKDESSKSDEDRDEAVKAKASVNTGGPDVASAFGGFGGWLSNAMKPMKSGHGIGRWAITTLAVGICYLVMGWGLGNMSAEGANTAQKFGGFALVMLGGLPLAFVLFFLGVMANAIIRVAIEKCGSYSEWPDFSLPDWASQFIYLGTSFWMAAIPGVIIGSLLMFATDNMIWLYSLIVFSSIVLAPVFLASVVFNESPWSFVSTEVFRSIRVLKNRWIRFFVFATFAGLAIGLSIYLIKFGMVGFLVAGVQALLLFMYWWALGDLVGHVVRWMTEK